MSIKPLKLSREQEKIFQDAVQCCICKQPPSSYRVREHDHLSGEYRGAAHSECNLRYRQPKSIPIIFHNLRNYDGRLLMSELGKFKDHVISVIATTLEKFITFRLKKTRLPCPASLFRLLSVPLQLASKTGRRPSSRSIPNLKRTFSFRHPSKFTKKKGNFPLQLYNFLPEIRRYAAPPTF